MKKVDVVAKHHRLYGRDRYLKYLIMVSCSSTQIILNRSKFVKEFLSVGEFVFFK